MERLDIEKQPKREMPPQKERRPKPPEELIEDLTAEVEELEEVSETEKKLGERFGTPKEEVHEVAEKYTFTEKLSSIKIRIGEAANTAIERIKNLFEKKEKIFEKTTMETIVESFDKYILKNPDAKAEEIAEFLSKNPENSAPPSIAELEKIKDIAERYEKNREGLKNYAEYLAEKHGVKEIPENPLELLDINSEIKKEFLKIVGLKGDIDPDKFVIHTEMPSALGAGFKNKKDFQNYQKQYGKEACKAEAFFSHRDYHLFREDIDEKDMPYVARLINNVYYVQEVKENESQILHEVQHQLFAKFFSELKQTQEQILLFDISKEKLAKIEREEGLKAVQEYFKKHDEIRGRLNNLEKNKVQDKALDEMAAYLKEGRWEYERTGFQEHIFGRFDKEVKGEIKDNFKGIKEELRRLKRTGYKAEDLYPIMVASKDLGEAVKRLKEIK